MRLAHRCANDGLHPWKGWCGSAFGNGWMLVFMVVTRESRQ